MAIVQQMASDGQVDLEDAVYVTRGQDGKTQLHQNHALHLSAKGAMHGALAGMMVGLFAFLPGLGLIGAGIGALAGHWDDHGIDDQFMKDLGAHLKPGSSAIFVLTPYATPKEVRQALHKHGGTVLQTTLTEKQKAKLRASHIDT
jgi:uncharacterized membrane protein